MSSKTEWDGVPDGIKSKVYRIRDLDMHVLEAGTASHPLIVLLHGFPELSYSWRKVILPLVGAGYHVVAPDQRGFGETRSIHDEDRPVRFEDDVAPYRMTNLVHDIVALVFGLGHTSAAAVVGHDFGSAVTAYCALIRPDIFRSAVCMSAPFTGPPPLPFDVAKEGSTPPQSRVNLLVAVGQILGKLSPPMKHYMTYFSGSTANDDMLQAPQGLSAFLRAYFHMKSGDWPANDPHPIGSASELALLPAYYIMPKELTMPEAVVQHAPLESDITPNHWLPTSELEVYVEQYKRTGFQGGLNWYRASTDPYFADRLSLFHGRRIDVPFMFIGGAKDWGVYQMPGGVEKMKVHCPRMQDEDFVLIEGAGHWVQQERPHEVLAHIFHFLQKTNK